MQFLIHWGRQFFDSHPFTQFVGPGMELQVQGFCLVIAVGAMALSAVSTPILMRSLSFGGMLSLFVHWNGMLQTIGDWVFVFLFGTVVSLLFLWMLYEGQQLWIKAHKKIDMGKVEKAEADHQQQRSIEDRRRVQIHPSQRHLVGTTWDGVDRRKKKTN